MVTAPGTLVNVQVPAAGKPFKITLPVAKVHVGCVMVPTIGVAGDAGCALITILADTAEIQPAELVTV